MYQTLESELLTVDNLTVQYRIYGKASSAVDKATLSLSKGKIHALVGESGCGKSTLGLSLSRLLPEKKVVYSGRVLYKGVDLLSLSDQEMQSYRGTEIATIFQEPMTALNPVYTVGEQIAEALRIKDKKNRNIRALSPRRSRNYLKSKLRRDFECYANTVRALLSRVRIANPESASHMYPHELSGGMKQRVMIAMALAQSPSLLVADEATTALDVTTQAQILHLIRSLTKELNMATLLITHDLGLVSAVADRVSVMYAGRIIEEAATEDLFNNPLHPYTLGLLESFPKGRKDATNLVTIPGVVPPIGDYPAGCRFHPRCEKAFEKCPHFDPTLSEHTSGHNVACFLYDH